MQGTAYLTASLEAPLTGQDADAPTRRTQKPLQTEGTGSSCNISKASVLHGASFLARDWGEARNPHLRIAHLEVTHQGHSRMRGVQLRLPNETI